VRDLRRRMGVLLGSRVLDFIRGDSGDHDRRADHVGGALLTSGASGHHSLPSVRITETFGPCLALPAP
jgi:hypothetical protein